MALEIRPARADDVPVIVEYNRRLARETEAKTLDSQALARGVDAVLVQPARGRYFIAERDDRIVGQLLITYEWSDWRNGLFWWLQSVYVAPAARRSGVFRALYSHVAALARQDPAVCGLRLYVDADNGDAQRTYRALGLAMTRYQLMETELGAGQPSPER